MANDAMSRWVACWALAACGLAAACGTDDAVTKCPAADVACMALDAQVAGGSGGDPLGGGGALSGDNPIDSGRDPLGVDGSVPRPGDDAGPASALDAGGDAGSSLVDGGSTVPPSMPRPPGCGDGVCAASEDCGTCALDCAPCGTSVCTTGNCIHVDDTVQHQTISGWEATAQAGQTSPGFAMYEDELFDRVANELQLTRLRVEVKSTTVGGDFELASFDRQMTDVALPLKAKLDARGDHLWINVCVVGNHLKDDPAKYAAQALKVVQHMHDDYGVVPDSWEVALEPDVFGWDDPMLVGNALVAAGKLLADNGFDLDFVAPSNTAASHVPAYVAVMKDIPGIFDYWRELSYHRYDWPDASELQAIAALAQQYNLRTSMLEHLDSGHADLHADLTEANVSAWQQYTLAFPVSSDDGAQYYWPMNNGAVLQLANRARYLRQYFAYVRPGAVRVEATSTRTTLDPTAFITTDNRYVVVMNTAGTLTMGIGGLPAGTYGVTYTTATQTHASAPDLQVTAAGTAEVTIPEAGVLTVFQR